MPRTNKATNLKACGDLFVIELIQHFLNAISNASSFSTPPDRKRPACSLAWMAEVARPAIIIVPVMD